MSERFSYIITIHNKEDVLERTLGGVAQCASPGSTVLAVLDGCTDLSEEIVDAFATRSALEVRKIHLPDVHMLRSVNSALRQVSDGFSIVLQDDVVLEEPALERKLVSLYRSFGPALGVVSLRCGANVRRAGITEQLRACSLRPMIEECDFIQSPDDSQAGVTKVCYEAFYPRIAAINGPNCIPHSVVRAVGTLDEKLAPFGYDDPEYCLRAMKAGFINGVYPLRFVSRLEWGGTRRDPTFAALAARVHRRNRRYVWRKHGRFIARLWRSGRVPRGLQPIQLATDAHADS